MKNFLLILFRPVLLLSIKWSLIVFFLIASTSPIFGQITFNSAAHNDYGGVSSVTESFTVPAGNNQLVLVFIQSLNTGGNPTVTYDGQSMQSMTQAVSGFDVNGAANNKAWIFYLAYGDHPSATTGNVVVSGGNSIWFVGRASFNGVAQSSTVVSTFEEGAFDPSGNDGLTTHTHTFSTTSGNLLVNYVSHNNPNHISGVGAGQTEFGFLSTTYDAGSYKIAGSASEDMSFSLAFTGQVWNHLAVEFNKAVTASTAPEIALSANSNNIADGANLAATSTTNGTDFASVCVDGGSAAITYTITNSGNADLTLDGTAPNYVTLSGGNAGDFSVTTQPSSGTVPHTTSNTATFEITFNPTATGERSTTVSIDNNDSDEDPFDFVIKGTGVQPTITVAATTASVAENSGSSLVYRFTRTTCTVETLAVNFSISGTAADADYTVVTGGTGLVTYNAGTNTGTITFPTNSSTVDLTVTPVGDTDIEGNETVVVNLEP